MRNIVKKPITLFIAFLCAVILAGCAVNPVSPHTDEGDHGGEEQHREDCSEHSPNVEESHSDIETDSVLFESNGYSLSLPGDYIDSVIVNPEDNIEESPEYTLFSVYYQPSYDDIQIWSPEEWEPYSEALEACCPAAMETFVQLNHLEEYSDDAFWESTETYSGEHRYLRYYPYRAYPEVDTTENKEMYYTIMLSQPVKQGSEGIWCVERVYDAAEYGYIYAIFPREDDRSAMEVYAELQASADEGNDRELLDPLRVALEFVKARYGHAKATADSFEEVQGPPEGHYTF